MLEYLKEKYTETGKEGGQHVDYPLGHFWHEGPNGRYACIVSKLAGPSVHHMERSSASSTHSFGGEGVRKLSKQLLQTLSFMHSDGK